MTGASKNHPLCIGHRGAMGYEPENTLRSIRRAIELNADGVEIDVKLIGSELIVIHDDTLERTTNGKGSIFDHSVSALRALDAGHGEKIPLLDEVFSLIQGKVLLNIELKMPGLASAVTKAVQQRLRSPGWSPEKILLSSFYHDEVAEAKRLAPEIPCAPLICGMPCLYPQYLKRLQMNSTVLHWEFVPDEFISEAHSEGLGIFVYTVNSPEEIVRLSKKGVDGIITNYPDRVISERASTQKR